MPDPALPAVRGGPEVDGNRNRPREVNGNRNRPRKVNGNRNRSRGSQGAVPVPVHARRALAQAGLVAALLAVFTVCAAAAGTSALLLTAGSERALSAAVALADGTAAGGGADVTSVVVTGSTVTGPLQTNAATLTPLIRRTLEETAAPYRAEVSVWSNTPMLYLDGEDVRCAYLLDADTVSRHAALLSGTWPAPTATEVIGVAVPAPAARALGLDVGTRMRLSAARSGPGPATSYLVEVTGVFTADATQAWDRDTLQGRGYHPDYLRLPTAGPFVVAPGTLAEFAAPVERVTAVLDPDLAADAAGVPAFVDRLAGLGTRLKDAAGPAINPVVVWSGLGAEFARLQAELAVTNALVLAVFVPVLVLGAVAAALVARVLLARRGTELVLLGDRGASAGQLVRAASIEAVAIALVAAVAALPVALAAYGATAPTTPVAIATAPGQDAPSAAVLAAALLAGAVLPALVMVGAMLPERQRRGRHLVSGRLARSGIDVLLVAVAVVAYLQLRAHVAPAGTIDPLLVAGPAVCVLALAAVAMRALLALASWADAAAGRARSLVLPLAGWHVARGGAARGGFLLVLATAVATLGTAVLGTWSASQGEQAAAQVGADLVVTRPGTPATAQELRAATGGQVTPVSDRAVVLGSRPNGVKLLALDAALAGSMLTSRPPDGTTWPQVLTGLAPQGGAVPLDTGRGPTELTITGGLAARTAGLPAPVVTATPTLVLADEAGSTATQAGTEVALDGRPHTVRLPAPGEPGLPEGNWRVVAIDLLLADHTAADLLAWGNNSAGMRVQVSVRGASSGGGAWGAAGDPGEGAVRPEEFRADGGTVAGTFSYSVLGLSWQDAHLTLLSFPAAPQLPVALSDGLATELGLATGDRIGLAWDTISLEAVVVRTVPYVPGHAREAALLADRGSLQRALLSAGALGPVTDAWWVAGPRPGAAEALRAAGSGPVVDRAETAAALLQGPLRAPLPVAWWYAIAAAVGLAVAGSAANAAAEAQRRATTLARVRALGVSRREALASHLAQHAAVTVAAVLIGALCGALLAVLLAPLLVVAPGGERAVPTPHLEWAGTPTLAVVGGIPLAALLAGVPAALSVVRRSTAAALRAGEAP